MDNITKKNIRLLAEKYHHSIFYEKDILVLQNQINQIKIWQTNKYGLHISYNMDDIVIEQEIPSEKIYDFIIKIFYRVDKREEAVMNVGTLLTIEEWIAEEGVFAKEQLEKLKADVRNETIDIRNLGGNRFEVAYYKGILIVRDDLCWAASNVIPLN